MHRPYHFSPYEIEDEMMPDLFLEQRIYFYAFHHFFPSLGNECSSCSELSRPVLKLHYKFVFIGLQMPSPEYIVDVESMDIFPVGWCEANAYNLIPPHKAVRKYMKPQACLIYLISCSCLLVYLARLYNLDIEWLVTVHQSVPLRMYLLPWVRNTHVSQDCRIWPWVFPTWP